MNKHDQATPRPWATIDGAEIYPTTGDAAHVECVRVVGPWDDSRWYDKETAKANARLIVEAVNQYDAVRELIELAHAILLRLDLEAEERGAEAVFICAGRREPLRAALAKLDR